MLNVKCKPCTDGCLWNKYQWICCVTFRSLEVGAVSLRSCLYHLQFKEARNFPGPLKLASELPKLNKCDQAFKNADKLIPINSKYSRMCRCMTCLNANRVYLKDHIWILNLPLRTQVYKNMSYKSQLRLDHVWVLFWHCRHSLFASSRCFRMLIIFLSNSFLTQMFLYLFFVQNWNKFVIIS